MPSYLSSSCMSRCGDEPIQAIIFCFMRVEQGKRTKCIFTSCYHVSRHSTQAHWRGLRQLLWLTCTWYACPPVVFLVLYALRVVLNLQGSTWCLTRFGRKQVASWGGYSFIINLLPIHCLASIFTGRLTAKLYIAYAPLIVLGTLEAGAPPVHEGTM